jgi:hypothetical protein
LPLSFRVKIDQNEIEISGTPKEVMKTIDDLPKLIENVFKAFRMIPPDLEEVETETELKKDKPLTVKLKPSSPPSGKRYPSIKKAKNCSQAVLKLLKTEWGMWRPRTMGEIVESLKANAIHYPSSTLSGVLSWLVKRGKVRRWKTDAGYVYIIAEDEA